MAVDDWLEDIFFDVARDVIVASKFVGQFEAQPTQLGSRAVREISANDEKCNCCAWLRGRKRIN